MKKFLLVMALAVGATGFAQNCKRLAQKKIVDKIKIILPPTLFRILKMVKSGLWWILNLKKD